MSGRRSTRRTGRSRATVAGAAALALTSLLLAGCGLGAGEQADAVHLRVTDGFGATVLAEPDSPKQAGSDTVMRLLQRNAKVQTRYGGGFVQSIDGRSGQADAGKQIDWFFYVNGLLAGRGAASWRVREGERIWWDRHRWELSQTSAVVGDYPQPMKSGHDGRYAGAQLDCRTAQSVCDDARERLEDAGVRVTVGEAAKGADRTRIVVGPWARIRGAAREVERLAGGPAVSGVYARLAADGTPSGLDDAGRPVARAAVGTTNAGLVAALKPDDATPLWILTGRDDAAVAGAVAALDAAVLAGTPAVLITDGRARALPLRRSDEGRAVGT